MLFYTTHGPGKILTLQTIGQSALVENWSFHRSEIFVKIKTFTSIMSCMMSNSCRSSTGVLSLILTTLCSVVVEDVAVMHVSLNVFLRVFESSAHIR